MITSEFGSEKEGSTPSIPTKFENSTIFNNKNLEISKTCSIFAMSNQNKGCSWDFDKDKKQDEFFDILEQLNITKSEQRFTVA